MRCFYLLLSMIFLNISAKELFSLTKVYPKGYTFIVVDMSENKEDDHGKDSKGVKMG